MLRDTMHVSVLPKEFVIISTARSGSNHLVSLLNNHPSVRCYGEVFGKLNYAPLRSIDWRNKMPNVWIATLKTTAISKQYLGYKLMYEHCPRHMAYVLRAPHIKIIWLTRQNTIKRYVSFIKALQNKVWRSSRTKKAAIGNKKITINTQHMLTKMRAANATLVALQAQLVQLPGKSLQVTYEDLSQNAPIATWQSIIQFLQLPDIPLPSSDLRKQNSDDLTKSVSNITEVQQAIRGTEFESLLP
jgi:LPS sulfotransferase NodH